jgi:hypothetical protein
MPTGQIIPLTGLLSTIALSGYMAVQLNGQANAAARDLTKAAAAEVKDSQGRVVLSGQFAHAEEGDEIERKATLKPTDVDTDAAGEAEVEFTKATPAVQEVEFAVRNLQPDTTFTFVIDGAEVTTAKTDRRGQAEIEMDVRFPGATASR